MNPQLFQFLLGCFVAIGSFNYGYDNSVITEVIASSAFNERFKPTAAETGAVVSVFTGGAFAGAIIAGFLNDWVGRRATIFSATIVFYVGAGLQTGASHLNHMYAGRVFAGLAVGIFYMVIPIYQSEIAHPSIRGRISALQQSFLGIGAVVSSWISYGCYIRFDDDKQYRLPLGLQLVPTFFLMLFVFTLPESPRWLVKKGKREQGLQTLARIHSKGNVQDAFVVAEMELIISDVDKEIENAQIPIWKIAFGSRSNFRRLFMAVTLQASVQMTGVSAISYFIPTIYSQMQIDTAKSLLLAACSGLINLFIAQTSCIWLIDKLGRRWPIIVANFLQALTFVVGCILMAKYPLSSTVPESAQIGFIATTWIFGVIFAIPGTTSWIIPAEIFNIQLRSLGVAAASCTSFAFNTMISQVTTIAMERIGYKFWFLFIVCNITNALFFYCFLPETGKTPLEKMDQLWQDAPIFIPSWNRHDYLKELEEVTQEVEASGVLEKGEVEEVERV
uniref:ARAD1D50622p n=1 Tax=Blastobotrys adeninivorans TaxID=409370 RepID=A0A060TDT3_BLAAD